MKKEQFTAGLRTYKSYTVQAMGNTWTVMVVTMYEKLQYLSVRKETNNPGKTIGKEFTDFDAATRHYKSPEMKVELLKIETGII